MYDSKIEEYQNEVFGQAHLTDGDYNFSFVAYDYAEPSVGTKKYILFSSQITTIFFLINLNVIS